MKKLVIFFLFLVVYFSTPSVYADNPGPAGVLQLQEMLQRFINLSVALAFLATTVMLVWGGFKLLTSGGEPKLINEGWQVITWALLGIVFMAAAWIILLVIKNATGVDVTKFCIGFPGAPTKCY